ncbi:MAG: hypothetical protein ACHQF2_10380 [Flavobacteriales bacterium]
MKRIILSFLFVGIASFTGVTNCKSFYKKKCRPQVAPYTHNGQMNNAVLRPGDKAEIMLTFNSGKEYRLIICAMENLGKVKFKVMDIDRNVIYTNEKERDKKTFDFKVASTQQLIVEMEVPDKTPLNEIQPEGCVNVLVGFK